MRSKADSLEAEARQAKEQLAELTRAATDYNNIIQQKESDITRLKSELSASKHERGQLMKEAAQLQSKIENLSAELQSEQVERKRDSGERTRLQTELDELRALLEAKTNEDTRRAEADKSKEEELLSLRSQVNKLSQDLADVRKGALEAQSKLKVDLDTINREHASLQHSHKSLSDKERAAQEQLKKTENALSEAEKAKRTLDSELQHVRSRQLDLDTQLAEALKEKEVCHLIGTI